MKDPITQAILWFLLPFAVLFVSALAYEVTCLVAALRAERGRRQ